VRPSRAVSGWATFAGVSLALAGVLNVIYGIATLRNRGYFEGKDLLWSNISTWGWLAIALGALELLIATQIHRRTMAGAIGGMAAAIFAFIANFLSVGAYPIWSVTMMVVNGFVIWALPRSVEANG
jgi:nitrate reductase NapE component